MNPWRPGGPRGARATRRSRLGRHLLQPKGEVDSMRKIACSLLTLFLLSAPAAAQSITVPATKALMLASLLKSLADAGHALRWYDRNQDYAKGLMALKSTATVGVPALVLLEKGGPQDGRVVAAVRLPADEAGVLKAIRD